MEWIDARYLVPTREVFYVVLIDEAYYLALWLPDERVWFSEGSRYKHIEDVTHFAILPPNPEMSSHGG